MPSGILQQSDKTDAQPTITDPGEGEWRREIHPLSPFPGQR